VEKIAYIFRNDLCVGSRSRAADVHIVSQLSNFVRCTVRHIHSGAGPGVGGEDDAAVVADADDGGPHPVLPGGGGVARGGRGGAHERGVHGGGEIGGCGGGKPLSGAAARELRCSLALAATARKKKRGGDAMRPVRVGSGVGAARPL
jgi:hypothetical protein